MLARLITPAIAALLFCVGCDNVNDQPEPDDARTVLTAAELEEIYNPRRIGGAPLCGNAGVVDPGEDCDYSAPSGPFSIGNGVAGSYCSGDCRWRCEWPGANVRPLPDGRLCVTPILRTQCLEARRCVKVIEDESVARQLGECIADAQCRAGGRIDCDNSWPGASVADCQAWHVRALAENRAQLGRDEAECNAILNC